MAKSKKSEENTPKEKICKYCDKPFKARRNQQVYCNNDCYLLSIKGAKESAIREYTKTTNMMIADLLDKGLNTKEIAGVLNRDIADLKNHIDKITQSGEIEKRLRERDRYRKRGLPNAHYW